MKFEVFQSENNERHYFRLKAQNGQVILSSQGYAGKDGCSNGIESVRKNVIDDAMFERKENESGKFFFNLKAGNGQIIGSSQMYTTKAAMEKGIEAVKKAAPQAVIATIK